MVTKNTKQSYTEQKHTLNDEATLHTFTTWKASLQLQDIPYLQCLAVNLCYTCRYALERALEEKPTAERSLNDIIGFPIRISRERECLLCQAKLTHSLNFV